MSAPDFYFGVNVVFQHIHDHFGKATLIDYWQNLGRDYYHERNMRWQAGGIPTIADDWRDYFDREPNADVDVTTTDDAVTLDIHVCPAIHHLRQHNRDIVPYYCEHCDHVCGAQAQAAGFRFERTGGMGACQQRFVKISVTGGA